MNKIKSFCIALLASAAALTSCSDYLEVKLDDQLSLDKVFSKRTSTYQYLKHIYSYLPYEAQYLMQNSYTEGRDGDGAATAMSDESHFSWTAWVPHLNFVDGTYGPTTIDTYWNNWHLMYTGIEQAGIFMENVGSCPELSSKEKTIAAAEARFIRAYCYFQIFRRFGPAFIWGDRRADNTIRPESIDRNTVDENVDFMISEIDKAIFDLPLTIDNGLQFDGRITKGAAMAAKSRILLYAASPLFNGCDLYKGQMMNKDGKYLFPQTPDPNKWTLAAKAAKEVIDLNMYKLYRDESEKDRLLKGIKSYMGIQLEPWNCEIIWGYWPRTSPTYSGSTIAYMNHVRMCPNLIIRQGCPGYCPSLKLFDTYPMQESGRYPVTGYDDNGNPIIDPLSGYSVTGFENDWEHPIEGPQFGKIKAHKSCVGRDARFYASVLANGMYWVNAHTSTGGKTLVTFFTGSKATAPYTNIAGDNSKVGLVWRRFLDPKNDYQNDVWGNYFFFYYRLGEIYLNYAEACNEMPNRNESEALKYVNEIRDRAGLDKLEVAYPEVIGNQALLRELIRKERMVELAFENHRYYDCRRWMTAEKEFNGLPRTLNVLATNYEDSWQRTDQVWNRRMVFQPKHYFIPLSQKQLSEMRNITQNYGW